MAETKNILQLQFHLLIDSISYKRLSLQTHNSVSNSFVISNKQRLLQKFIQKMKKTYVLRLTLLALLLCKSCSSAPNSNGENAVANERPNLKFMDLPNNVLRSIFTNVEFSDLVEMIKVNKKIGSINYDIFQNNYRNYEVHIEVMKRHPYGYKFHVFPNLRKHIIIYDFEFALYFLQYFGASIHSLRISNHYVTRDQSARINKFANDYAAEAITSLNLDIMKGNTLAQFIAPFERVENLTCDIFEEQIGANILPFNQLFPQLKRLTMQFNTVLDHKYLNCTLPHLEHLAITKSSSDPNRDTNQIDNFIRRNEHIRSIEIVAFAPDYIEFIGDSLPNLINLTVRYTDRVFPDNYRVASFENVQHFEFDDTFPHAIDKMTFKHLESVKLFYSQPLFNEMLQFFTNHQNISKLFLRASWRFDEEHLKALTSALPNLVEITLQSHEHVTDRTILTIIDNHEKLNCLKMLFKREFEEQPNNFDGILDGWIARNVRRGKEIVLERKQ